MKHLMLVLMLFGCGQTQDFPELVTTIRGVGVVVESGIMSPSTDPKALSSGSLSVYALAPKSESIDKITSFLDTTAAYSVPVESVIGTPEAPLDLGALQLYKIPVTFSVPTAQTLGLGLQGVYRARYGVRLANASRTEVVVGDVLLAASGNPALDWKAPAVVIAAPQDGSTVSVGTPVTLTASITKTQEERVEVFWFVSTGSVDRVSSKDAKWTPKAAGEHTVVVGVYGKSSRLFGIATAKVQVSG